MFDKVLTKDVYMAELIVEKDESPRVKFLICKKDKNNKIIAGWLLKEDKEVEVKGIIVRGIPAEAYDGENHRFIANLFYWPSDRAFYDDDNATYQKLFLYPLDREKELLWSNVIIDKQELIKFEDKVNSTLKQVFETNQELEEKRKQELLKVEKEIESNYPFNK